MRIELDQPSGHDVVEANEDGVISSKSEEEGRSVVASKHAVAP